MEKTKKTHNKDAEAKKKKKKKISSDKKSNDNLGPPWSWSIPTRGSI